MNKRDSVKRDALKRDTLDPSAELMRSVTGAIDQLQITPQMQQNIIRQVRGKERRSSYKVRRLVTVAAVSILTLGIVGIPVGAYVLSLVNERMEQVPEEELDAIVQAIDDQEAEADAFSREYSETERDRMIELQESYLAGTFPEGVLLQVADESEAVSSDFYFVQSSADFHLPDRELTDEELLQIIDFDAKRTFALKERYETEFADEVLAQEEMEEADEATIISAEGIGEAEAIELAKAWLASILSIDATGLEITSFPIVYDDMSKSFYSISFITEGSRNYQSLFIDAMTGDLEYIQDRQDALYDDPQMPIADLADNVQTAYEAAELFLKERMGLDQEYEAVYYNYRDDEGTVLFNYLWVIFVEADGSAHMVACSLIDGQFAEYTAIENYDEYLETLDDNVRPDILENIAENITKIK
ncbi:MAG: hypothetical protein LBV33_01450 [Lachnospiraceae bacterium]|jgi:hypothetical protein|nr:hypothetical protein [Lachnospiraceae bacterium]